MRFSQTSVGQKLLTWIRLIMICYIVPWWQSWLLDQIAFSNSESVICCLKSFKIATLANVLDTGTECRVFLVPQKRET